jgi:predicted DCC family thiol-disulfide oxidoreductase YuxK
VSARGAHALLYDAECGVCRTIVGSILALDRGRRLRPVALQAPDARELLPGMSLERRMASFHLVSPAGEVTSAGAALAQLASLLPGGRLVARALAARPGTTNRGYELVARNRFRLGSVVPRWLRSWADGQIARRT